MPSRRRSSFSRTTIATAPRVGARNANTSSRLNAAAAATWARQHAKFELSKMASKYAHAKTNEYTGIDAPRRGSKTTAGHGKGFTATSTRAGRSPAPSERPRMALVARSNTQARSCHTNSLAVKRGTLYGGMSTCP